MLKLGGSVITEKGRAFSHNISVIERIVKEIYESKVSSLIIIHGGGSYGHPIANYHGIADGFKERKQLLGFSKTHEAMVSLNKILVKNMLDQSIPAFQCDLIRVMPLTTQGLTKLFGQLTVKPLLLKD